LNNWKAKEIFMDATQTAVLEAEQDQHVRATPGSTIRLINKIKRINRKRLSAEDKIRIVLEGFRKELSVTDLCRRESIHVSLYYSWLKDFMEAGKSRLKGDSIRSANENEVKHLQAENNRLKSLAGEQALELCLLKKSLSA
jgi:transposase